MSFLGNETVWMCAFTPVISAPWGEQESPKFKTGLATQWVWSQTTALLHRRLFENKNDVWISCAGRWKLGYWTLVNPVILRGWRLSRTAEHAPLFCKEAHECHVPKPASGGLAQLGNVIFMPLCLLLWPGKDLLLNISELQHLRLL